MLDPAALLLALLAFGLGIALALALRRQPTAGVTAADLVAALGEMRASMDGFRSDVGPTLQGVQRTVGQVEEQARHIEAVGRDIASLQDILSVDYPFVANAPGTKWMEDLPLNAEDKAKILNGNARRLLRM